MLVSRLTSTYCRRQVVFLRTNTTLQLMARRKFSSRPAACHLVDLEPHGFKMSQKMITKPMMVTSTDTVTAYCINIFRGPHLYDHEQSRAAPLAVPLAGCPPPHHVQGPTPVPPQTTEPRATEPHK